MRVGDNNKVQCPVCNMTVDKNSYAKTYQGRSYGFCSLQCRDRFESNPHLYIGRPGYPAPKQQGHEIIKNRKMVLTVPLNDDQRSTIKTEIEQMMGIRSITIDSQHISICYDLLQVTSEQIESVIEETGNRLSLGMGTKLKQAFIHYLEESELDNLEQTSHCHRH